MKKNYLFWVAFVVTTISFGQLTSGDIAFVAFNADGRNDFAFVTLVDIPEGTSIWFTDNDWQGSEFEDLNEGVIEWNSDSIILAGTVVIINNDGVNFGIVLGGIDLNAADETLFALFEEPATSMSSPIFLAGISNDFNQSNSTLAGTGLTKGLNFIDFNNDKDGFKYTGQKFGEINFVNYLSFIMNILNWKVEDDEKVSILPISTTPFSISTAGIVKNEIDGFSLYPNPVLEGELQITSRSKENKQLEIYAQDGKRVYSKNVNGDETINVANLTTGIYFLKVEEEGKIATRKLIIK